MNGKSAGAEATHRGDQGHESLSLALLRVAHRGNWPTMLVQFAASIGVYLAARSHAPAWYDGWIAVVLAISVVRVWADRGLAQRLGAWAITTPGQLRILGAVHSGGLLASAVMWAILAWVRLPVETVQIQFTVIVVVSALVGGASGVLAPLITTGRIYVITLLGPACARILMAMPDQQVLGVLGGLFMLVILGMHRNNHLLLVRSIQLAWEKLDLVQQLQARNLEMAEVNHTLEDRVAARTEDLKTAMTEAQAANRLKSEFLATMSHEIRTPLNAVLGMAQIMQNSRLPQVQTRRLSIIESAAGDLLRMFSDVLDLSRLESGTLELAPDAFALTNLLERVTARGAALAAEKRLEFRTEVTGVLAERRFGDALRLEQIIGNLLSNAAKFTERGYIGLQAHADSDELVLRIVDTGVGVPEDFRPRIFQPFVQADVSHTRRAGGLGVGLALSRDLALRLGGDLTLEPGPERGSCFVLTVPLPVVEATPPVAPAGPSEPPPSGAGRVLVVDDNPVNRLVLMTLLKRMGVTAQPAADGREALEAWRSQHWDAILMDINMPVMDGVEATRTIRREERTSARRRTPIIAVSANAQPEDAAAYRAAGMDEVLAKPVDAPTLTAALSQHAGIAKAA